MKRHGVRCEAEMHDSDFIVRVIPGHVRQIMDNLFRNSLYWLKDTKERFTDAPNPTIKIVTDPRSRLMKFSDTGVGIATDDIDWIFDAFNTHREGGRGLGLYICKEIAAFNRIEIEIDSGTKNQWNRFNSFIIQFKEI